MSKSTKSTTQIDATADVATLTADVATDAITTNSATATAEKTELLRTLLTESDRDCVTALLTELGFTITKANTAKVVSKQQLANVILDVEYAKPVVLARKDLIALLMNHCNMGKDYASTALQLYREKHGLVNHKA